MDRMSFLKRFLFPLLLVVGIKLIAGALYDASSTLSSGMLRDISINVFGPLTFISLWFFGFVGPPIAFFRGASFMERLIIAFANPVIWIITVEAKIACQFTPVQMVYFFFLPWTFGIICLTCVEFSIADLVCRFIVKKKTMDVRVLHPAVMTMLVLGLTGVFVSLIKGQVWVYFIVHHYQNHFL